MNLYEIGLVNQRNHRPQQKIPNQKNHRIFNFEERSLQKNKIGTRVASDLRQLRKNTFLAEYEKSFSTVN